MSYLKNEWNKLLTARKWVEREVVKRLDEPVPEKKKRTTRERRVFGDGFSVKKAGFGVGMEGLELENWWEEEEDEREASFHIFHYHIELSLTLTHTTTYSWTIGWF